MSWPLNSDSDADKAQIGSILYDHNVEKLDQTVEPWKEDLFKKAKIFSMISATG